jgi:protein kinase-like protein
MFREGQTLKDTYRVDKKLDGSKTAYKVTHVALKVPFVMELVLDETGLEELDFEDRRVRQGEALKRRERLEQFAAVSHPRLARIVDVYQFEERQYLIREWAEGYTLRELVEHSLKPLDQKTAASIGSQLLNLIEELHQNDPSVFLGTLCPDYMVVDPEGNVKVLDYGLAVHARGKTEFEPFSCPEMLGGGKLDVRAEIYSVGAILYFAVTGMELPPIWDRITYRESIPSPLELQVKVDGRFWSALEKMLQLAVDERPQSLEEVRALFQGGDFEHSPESSPATWYPEQDNMLLADAYPFMPMGKADWILKMVQAAVVGQARDLKVKQTRELCALDFRFAAPDVPAPQAVLEALTSDGPVVNPVVAEMAAGLRVVGEFRDFRLVLDDWKQSWSLRCKGGRLSSRSGESHGRSGVYLEVMYEGRAADRAAQSADELIRLVRKTRLCTVPITVDKMPLEPGRGVELSELPRNVVELYLTSASFPTRGGFKLVRQPDAKTDEPEEQVPMTTFVPSGDRPGRSHVDVRCLIASGDSKFEKATRFGYHYIRRPSRVLWYRRGVLCGERKLEKQFSLQLDIHINGDDLECDSAGLKVTLPDWISVARMKPVLELQRILPITRLKLEEFWESKPTQGNAKSNIFMGMVGAPLLLVFFSGWLAPGLIFLKKAAIAGAMKTSTAVGGVLGLATAKDHLKEIRKTCLKAIDNFDLKELA